LQLLQPARPDDLIDEKAFEADERLPYWAELWPSGRSLARHVIDHRVQGCVIELGCGAALPSLTILALGGDVLATDYEMDAILLASRNATLNGLPPLKTRVLDWRSPSEDLGRFDVVLAADVLYEARNVKSLADGADRLTVDGGRLLLADPGRRHEPAFRALMQERGWTADEVDRVVEPQANAAASTISIMEYRRG
jgi:predicted nicotinamide N-methyase